MRDQHEHIDEHFVSRALDLEVFEEHVDSKDLECLLDDVFAVDGLEGLVARPFQLGLERNERQSAGDSSLEIVVSRVQGLSSSSSYHEINKLLLMSSAYLLN